MKNTTFPITDHLFVENLIPQKHPFVQVDRLLEYAENILKAGLEVQTNNIFVAEGFLHEPGIIEHMAQAVALYTGYQYFLKKEPAPVGYIGAIKQVEIFKLPKVNDILETEVYVLQEFAGVTLVNISTFVAGKPIAQAQMKTVLAA